jgi:CRP-like cAMP-binding protein
MVEKITDFLLDVSPFPDSVVQTLHGLIRIQELSEKHKLLLSGNVSKRVYFILEGVLRAYVDNDAGDSTIWIMKELDVVFAVRSFYHQEPSNQFIETLTPAIVGSISYDDLQRVYAESLEFNVVGRLLNERYNVLAEDRANMLRQHKATERYQLFLELYPGLIDRIPRVYIASYLGMTADTLCKIVNGNYPTKKKNKDQ